MDRRILIVDGDPLALDLLGQHLEMAGYEVMRASDGLEAMRMLLAEGPPMVIADWMMPGLNGIELCRAIRESEAVGIIYIILLTEHDAKKRVVEAFEAGADDFLAKPFDPQELLARLKAGMRIIRLEADLARHHLSLHKTNAELAVLNEKLDRMATTDELTALPNRRSATARLGEMWASAKRHNQPLACFMLDIDHFKSFNDTHGHEIGDAVLRHVATLLKNHTRADEPAYRIGGEEFIVLCPMTKVDEAEKAGERLRKVIESSVCRCHHLRLSVTVSVGVAERNLTTRTSEDMLRNVDEALYQAKRGGRNRVCTSQMKSAPAQTSPAGG